MMNARVLVLAIVLCACENKEVDRAVNSNEISSFINTNYADDAKQIYVREINNDVNHPNYNIAELDSIELNKIMVALQAVYSLQSKDSDTVFNYYKIHLRHCYSLNAISLKVKPTMTEIVNLVNGAVPTGNHELDTVLSTYGFKTVKLAYDYPAFPWLSITTETYYNLIPIIKSFKTLPSILSAENDAICLTDGNNISLTREGDKIISVNFALGVRDCFVGCPYKIHWIFSVDGNRAKLEERVEGI